MIQQLPQGVEADEWCHFFTAIESGHAHVVGRHRCLERLSSLPRCQTGARKLYRGLSPSDEALSCSRLARTTKTCRGGKEFVPVMIVIEGSLLMFRYLLAISHFHPARKACLDTERLLRDTLLSFSARPMMM
jgi:hypothetical protein